MSVVAVLALTAVALRRMGRAWGQPKLWTSQANSPDTSQRLADPYTFTHVLHGILLYAALARLPWSLGTKLAVATSIEAAWEILENTDAVIQRYRAETVSLGYDGDAVINSIGDLLAMMAGFYLAHALPWWGSALVVAAVELVLLFAIRDNLTLNIIQLVAPSKKIKAWQQQSHVNQGGKK